MLQVESEELRTGLIVPGGYRLERVVGEGGMGVVWSATREKEKFALKFLRSDRSEDQKNIQRMIREARAAASVDHPNVARVVEARELDSGLPFIVMELLEGETLADRLRRGGPLSARDTARILAQVAGAIEAAQAAGIVHRDLKPDNVFLVKSGEEEIVKVLDFGIAKTLAPGEAENEATMSLTTTGTMIGTTYYMAPEQIFGDEDIDGRSDVWALGVMLYECLAGRRPTQASGIGQVIKLITTESFPPLRSVAPSAPADLANIAMRALKRSRDDRPTIGEMRVMLDRAMRGEKSMPVAPWLVAGGLVAIGTIGFFVIPRASKNTTIDAGITITIEPVDVRAPEVIDASPAIEASAPQPDAQAAIVIPRKPIDGGAIDAGAKNSTRDAAIDAPGFDIPIQDVRK